MTPVTHPPMLRFAEFISFMPNGCVEYTGGLTTSGYGRFWDGTRGVQAHRFAYEQIVGPIPEGLDLDHLCRNRRCVNPRHLDPVSRRENLLRGETLPSANAQKTHCPMGHPYAGNNLLLERKASGTWMRKCRECRRRATTERSRRRRAAERGPAVGAALTDDEHAGLVAFAGEDVIWRIFGVTP